MSIKKSIQNTKFFNNIKQTELYWKLKNKVMKAPAHIYLTLICNLHCTYCVNESNQEENRYKEYKLASAEKWIPAINKLNRDVALTGGEPTLHPDFIKIVNGINKKLSVTIYTNLTWSDEFVERIGKELKRPIKLLGSYHPSSGNPEKVLNVIKKLREKGLFEGIIHSVGTKQQEKFLEETVRPMFKKEGFFLTIDRDQYNFFDAERCSRKFRKTVKCSGKSIIIAPDGTRYQCVSKLVRRKDPLENIFEEDFKGEFYSSICPDYGYCAPCDMNFKIEQINSK